MDDRLTFRTERRQGLAFGTGAYLCWGLLPLYWPLLEPANATEILSMRMLWSSLFAGVLITVRGEWSGVRSLLRSRPTLLRLGIAAVLVSINWTVYIWAVNAHHVVETSLGYFILPLFSIVLGVGIYGERLRRTQWLAVGIAVSAVVVITLDYGRLPWIALTLAISFCGYGLLKKQVQAPATHTFAVETLILAVPALITVGVLQGRAELTFAGHGPSHTLLLAGTGVITAVPLLLFAGGARRLPLSSLGLLQYLAPVLQLAVGVGIRHEAFPPAQVAGFCLVWLALTILIVDGLATHRRDGRSTETDPLTAAIQS